MQHTAAMSIRHQSSCMSLQGSIQIGTKALTHMQQHHAFKLKSIDLKFDQLAAYSDDCIKAHMQLRLTHAPK